MLVLSFCPSYTRKCISKAWKAKYTALVQNSHNWKTKANIKAHFHFVFIRRPQNKKPTSCTRCSLKNTQMCLSSTLTGVLNGHPINRQKVLTEKCAWVSVLFLLLILPPGYFPCFRERMKETDNHRCEKDTPIGCLWHMPQPWPGIKPHYVPLIKNWTCDLSVHRPENTGLGVLGFLHSTINLPFNYQVQLFDPQGA